MTAHFPSRRLRLTLLFATALVSAGVFAGSASAVTSSFSNTTPIDIPDSGPGSVYPSTVDVSGFTGSPQNVTVTLHGFSHTCPDDVAALLVSPNGTNSILMFDVGGCPGGSNPPAVDVTFDQRSTNLLNDTDDITSGTFAPAEGTIPNDLTPPAPAGPYPVNLVPFNAGPANGTWQLYIDDQAGGDHGTIAGGWSLAMTAPIDTVALGRTSFNHRKGVARIPVTVKDSGALKLGGKGVATVASAGATKSIAVQPGTRTLTVKARGKQRKKLLSTGHVKVTATITFTPTGSTPKSTPVTVNLRKKLKK